MWRFAEDNRDAILAHWQNARARNPNYFNGTIQLIDGIDRAADGINAQLLRTDFMSYLYWRESGWPEAGVLDGFGSALIRSHDGDILLGRQCEGHVNAGLTYLPGGFIDARDVNVDGSIDIRGSVARELLEETGLGPGAVTPEAGYYLTETGPNVSLAVSYVARAGTSELKKTIEDHIRAEANPELAGIVVIRQKSDLEGLSMAHYARVLVTALFEPG